MTCQASRASFHGQDHETMTHSGATCQAVESGTRLLLIEDDRMFARALRASLEEAGFDVTHCEDGLEGWDLARSHAWSVVILDLMIPTIGGADVLRRLREESNVPVLVLTARRSLEQRVGRLEDGADDYLSKPFEMPELLARLRALIRRSAGGGDRTRHFGNLEIDLFGRTASLGGAVLDLTSTEFRLLECLLRQHGKAVATARLAKVLSPTGDPIRASTVRAHVRNLREKLGQRGVRTRRGFGYYFDWAP